ncbi:hypothetical protein QQF64_035760, partial [Cirrhinus molitorella]
TGAWHNNSFTTVTHSPSSKRVGIYLDWLSGTLSSYSVSDTHTLTHTHTHSTPLSLNPSMLDSRCLSLN